MGKKSVAAGPKQTGACASFFVGTPVNEPQLRMARTWAKQIVAAVGDDQRAQLNVLVSINAMLNQLRLMQDVIAQNKLDTPPAPLNGLNLPTLILLVRATTASQGLLLYGVEGSKDAIVLGESELGTMSLKDVTDPLARKAVVTSSSDQRLKDAAFFLDFLRRSSYTALYPCIVGGGAIDKIAPKLAELSDLTVFYNTTEFRLTEDDQFNLKDPDVGADGPKYAGGGTVRLKSDTKTFLPGSEKTVTPP